MKSIQKNSKKTSIRSYHLLLLYIGLFLITGCIKFLDKKYTDSYTQDQVFANEYTIQEALNGLYYNLGSNDLYGEELSMGTTEVIAYRYNVPFESPYYNVKHAFYQQADVGSPINSLWTQAYSTILKTNVFIQQIIALEGKTSIISEAHRKQMLGEAYGIRGLIHFDLLRIFGPDNTTGSGLSIPYYTLTDSKTQPILHSDTVLIKAMADFRSADSLLAADPIQTTGVNIDAINVDFYNSYRNRRINYYALKGFEARLELYRGHTEAAHDSALKALSGEQWFPWTSQDAVTDPTDPDRIFSSEVMFGVRNPNLYSIYNTEFIQVTSADGLLPASGYPDALYESNTNDLRYISQWQTNGVSAYAQFNKYETEQDITKNWYFFVPVLRKSELYYILAETDPDQDAGFGYLNTVLENRGLQDLNSGSAVLQDEIGKEYQKEFCGEGQLMFYYKRIHPDEVLDGSNGQPLDAEDTDLGYFTFQVALPLSETAPR
jgi:starch-binding outer membrane protein, SusD/RagB family